MKKTKLVIIAIALAITYMLGFSDGQESAYLKVTNEKDYNFKKHYEGE
jgi:hypothetical protein